MPASGHFLLDFFVAQPPAVLAVSIPAPRHPLPPPLSLNEEGVGWQSLR